MIKKITQYLLQRRCALSLLLMLMLLQPAMAQTQDRRMYARLDRESQTLTLYYDKNKQASDEVIYGQPLWYKYVERKAIQTVIFDESFKDARPESCDSWFWYFEGLTRIEHLDYLNTSEVENMREMFSNCTSLEALDLSSFNTEKVTDMYAMFDGATNLRSIKLPKGFIGSSVTNLKATFRGCESLTELDLSGSNAEKVTNMSEMFNGCSALSKLVLTDFKTEQVTTMESMFCDCSTLETLDVYSFNTENVTTMVGMFNNCSLLRSLDLSGFNTANVTEMSSMFKDCSSLRSLDLSSFNTRKVSAMQSMFKGCTNLESIDFSSFDTENMKSMIAMFNSCTKLETLDLSSFATPKMVTMTSAFEKCVNLKTIYVTSAFTTDKVTVDSWAFDGCVNLPNFNSAKTGKEMAHTGEGGYLTAATASWVRWDAPTGTLSFHCSGTKPAGDNILDLGYGDDPNWDTHAAEIKKVVFKAGFRDETHTTCSNWFNGCTNLTSIEGIENLNTSYVKNMSGMFAKCSNLETLDLSHFNTEKVTTMAQMFYGCTKLHNLNISSFNTENVSYMNGMFEGCSGLNTLDLSHFNTRYVRNDGMNYMFNGCSSLSSLDVSNFTTDKYSMQLDGLFQGCSSLQTLDLSSFDTRGAGSVNYLFDGCSALKTIYVSDHFEIPYKVKSSNMFRDCRSLKGANSFETTKKNETYANYVSGYLTKKVGTNGNEIIGATGYPLTIDVLPLDDSKAYTLYENCNVTSASYARAMKSEWGTLCLPFTIDPTSEANTCNFYTLQNIGNESVVLELIENGTVEAGQPVVIRKKDNTQTDILINNVEKAQVVKEPKNTNTGNRLMGTFTNMKLADDCYFIANNQFRLVSNYKPATSGVKLAAFRAYIQPQKTNIKHAPSLNISVNDETTGIETSNVLDLLNDKEAEYYDVNGRRIQNLQKGINIVKKGNKTMKIVCR
ncbi:BspA family leucine-rich repeat surface protein [uncultured Prevotella sp.]|uniref:BspA family leucine-rich repeat surface protein n=1 Tax=uncultured Prevotella sp. TaxID=159272 RepID=UPI0027E374D2|nr:BspA family leucine-rich repeat surface protein [uncultured Prevotella sp.]